MKNHSQSWLDNCRSIYKKNLPELRKKYGGSFIAIYNKEILDTGKSPYKLFEKYDKLEKSVELFYIPRKGESTSLEVRIPVFRI